MFGITGLTVPAWGGSFQRCLLCRCGEAEREFGAGRSQFLVIASKRFAGILVTHQPEKTHWAQPGPPVSLSYGRGAASHKPIFRSGGPVPSQVPHRFCPVHFVQCRASLSNHTS